MTKHGSAVGCLKTYLPFWRARGFSPTDVNIICHFLFSCGSYKEILRFSIECIEKDDPVSWFYLTRVLKTVEPHIRAPVFELIKEYINDHRKWDEFSTSELFEVLFPNETEVKYQLLQRRVQIKERHRQTLLDQIRVFNHSRNFNIEKQSILKFIKFFPQDKLGKEMLERYELEDLQRFFLRYQNERRQVEKPSTAAFSIEEISLLEKYYQQAFSLPGDDVESFVYFFLFLEDYAHALELVIKMPNSLAKNWLHLELLLLNKKFASALAYLHDELEPLYSKDATFYSAKIYYVARCLWGLDDHRKAIDLMSQLLQILPDYKMASILLKEWKSAV